MINPTGTMAAEPKGLRARLRMIREPGIQELLVARAASKLGIATLSYGGMIYLAREGASEMQVVLVGASGYFAALIFGLQGGILADIIPKRIALAAGLGLQGVFCLLMPILWGTDVFPLVSLIFAISMVSQLTSPAMKSAVRLVTTPARVASVAAVIALAGSIGAAVGSAFLAPILIRKTGIATVMYVTGVMLLGAAFKAISLPKDPKRAKKKTHFRLRDGIVSPHRISAWAMGKPAIASMILVGALVVALFESINSLQPVYVRDVLHADPTLSVYIFAPAGIGFLIGTLISPLFMKLIGERWLTVISMLLIASAAIAYGAIYHVAPVLALWSPAGLLQRYGIHLSNLILAAGVIAIPMNLGSTAAGASVQAYINRIVPLSEQGSTFGMQEVIEQAFTVILLLLLGAISMFAGTRIVFLVAPLVIIAIGTIFVRYSYHSTGTPPPGGGKAIAGLIFGKGIVHRGVPESFDGQVPQQAAGKVRTRKKRLVRWKMSNPKTRRVSPRTRHTAPR
ncbi:MAG: MFS transporter [Thermomicrobiales bacterium]